MISFKSFWRGKCLFLRNFICRKLWSEESNCYIDFLSGLGFCKRKGKETSFYYTVSCSNINNTGIEPDAASDIKFSGKALLKYWNKVDKEWSENSVAYFCVSFTNIQLA